MFCFLCDMGVNVSYKDKELMYRDIYIEWETWNTLTKWSFVVLCKKFFFSETRYEFECDL